MRAILTRQRLVRSAAAAASIVLLAACGANADGQGDPTAPGRTYSAGMLAISNGTDMVDIGGVKVKFPTTVTDAAWSPDGSLIAFVNADGNIATARVDGSDLMVHTAKADGVVRSRPTWLGSEILFAEQKSGQRSVVMAVLANGAGGGSGDAAPSRGEYPANLGSAYDERTDYEEGSAPSTRAPGGTTMDVAFQRKGAKGPEVWVVDQNARTPYQVKVADGTEPALAPDGTKVAFVDPTGQIKVAPTGVENPAPVQVTFGVASPSHLTWSADGANIAFQTPSGVASVSANVPAGATANPTTELSAGTGVPTYLRPQLDRVAMVTGADPVTTSIAASQASWPMVEHPWCVDGGNEANGVLLTGTSNLPVALAGAQMVDYGPLLFTTGTTLDARTASEIKRVLGVPTADSCDMSVTIVGGADIVSAQAENEVKAMGYKTERVAGVDAVATAVTAAGPPSGTRMVFVVDASDIAGYTAAISSLGKYSQQTVLLINGATLPSGVTSLLNRVTNDTKVFAVGANAQQALQSSWPGKPANLSVTSYVGKTPAATPALLLNDYSGRAEAVVIVNASSTSDVIVGIGLARRYGAPVLAVDGKARLDDDLQTWLRKSSASINNVMVVDSSGAVSQQLVSTVGGLVSGPLGYSSVNNPTMAPATR